MTAAEQKVRRAYPKARCGRDRGSPRTYYCIFQGDFAIGGGLTRAQAWNDAASRLTEDPEGGE